MRARHVDPESLIGPELARSLAESAARIRRQLGVLIDRGGNVRFVIVGEATRLQLPVLGRFTAAGCRFSGLRLVHIHLRGHGLDEEDLSLLSLHRLDVVMAIGLTREGLPGPVHYAHLLPYNPQGERLATHEAGHVNALPGDFVGFIGELEREVEQAGAGARLVGEHRRQRVLLVGVRTSEGGSSEATLDELAELAHSAGLGVARRYLQTRPRLDARTLVGAGKIQELTLDALDLGADMIIFDTPLTPAQARSIGDETRVEVLDRNQLILAIFGQRAQTRAGRVQVELAALRYELPRLSERAEGLSRITGGIGAQGPGETKLEIHRRRVKDRIARLEREIDELGRQRSFRRERRERRGVPVVALVGYTNAGKSSLFNELTASRVAAEDRLFATLDPTSRRVRLDAQREFVLADTVGFIRDLPQELTNAFRATLEELNAATLLVHVVDIANPAHEAQIASVERILTDLHLDDLPRLLVFNKVDLLEAEGFELDEEQDGALLVSARTRRHLDLLRRRLAERVECERRLAESPLCEGETEHG